MSKQEKYLFSLQNRGIKLGLERTDRLLKICNSPHKKIKTIQILGTNGKGSSSAILSQILRNNRLKIGLFTSPHLRSYTERIRVNGLPIDIDNVKYFIDKYQKEIEKIEASFFEVMTAMAAWYFNKSKVDYAIMETGLGGKYDSVTACNANIFGITSISKDHQNILGNSLKDIASEKVAAIKKKSIVFSVNQKPTVKTIINSYCKQNKCIFKQVKKDSRISLSLNGDHQKENASLAISIANHLGANLKNLDKCLMSIKWFGRNQIIQKNPFIVFDVAHNEQGIKSFLQFIKSSNQRFDQRYLLLSIQKTKKIKDISDELNDYFDHIYYTITEKTKSMEFEDIKYNIPKAVYFQNPMTLINKITSISSKDDLIAIIGTHFWGETVSNKFNISFDNL